MMIIFFVGMGVSALLVAATTNAWQLAAALTLLGVSAFDLPSGRHPMLVQNVPNPGVGYRHQRTRRNLGIAVAALVTGFLVKWLGWRARSCPGILAIVCGIVFAMVCPKDRKRRTSAKAQRQKWC